MKIKRVDDKRVVIHAKKKVDFHVRSTPILSLKDKNILAVTRKIDIADTKRKSEMQFVNKKKVVKKVAIQEIKNINPQTKSKKIIVDKRENRKQVVQKENHEQIADQKEKKGKKAVIENPTTNRTKMASLEVPLKQIVSESKPCENTKSSSNGQIANAAVTVAEKQLYRESLIKTENKTSIPFQNDSETIIGEEPTLTKMSVNNSTFENGKNLYRSKLKKKRAKKHIKKVVSAKKHSKKTAKETAIKSAEETTKDIATKNNWEVSKDIAEKNSWEVPEDIATKNTQEIPEDIAPKNTWKVPKDITTKNTQEVIKDIAAKNAWKATTNNTKKFTKNTSLENVKNLTRDTVVKSYNKAINNRIKTPKSTVKKNKKNTVKTSKKIITDATSDVLNENITKKTVDKKKDKQNIKKSTRNRMIQLFISKIKQEENPDSVGKVLKDLVILQFSIVIKKIIAYAILLLSKLFALVALVAIPIILILAIIYNSPFAIFFPSISSKETTQNVLSAYVSEFNQEVNTELNQHSGYDFSKKVFVNFEGSGTPDNYYDILVVYMVKYGNGDTATDMTKKAKENLKTVFDDMCSYNISTGTEAELDEEGMEITQSVKYINVTLKTYHGMIYEYGLSTEETEMLLEMMRPENLALLRGVGSDGAYGETISPEQYRAIIDAISDANGKKVVEFVLSRVGYPYSQEKRDSGSYYDCSSLAYYAWKNANVNIMYEGANTAASEGKYCYDNDYLVNYEEMQPGDLIFYSYAINGRFKNISHVAIYVGNGKVVEALNEQVGVIYRTVQNRSSIVFIGKPG